METALIFLSLLTDSNVFASLGGHVVGGDFATIEQYPFMASLYMSSRAADGGHIGWRCGSTILNQRLLLTAAHCLKMEKRESPKVVARTGNRNKMDGTRHAVSEYLVHEGYVTEKNFHDIALVLVRGSVTFGASTARAILMEQPPKYETAIILGWGLTDEDPPRRTEFLKFAKQRVWSHKECQDFIGPDPANSTIPPTKLNVLCAGDLGDEIDHAARGDSGGPLVVRKNIVVGVVSYSIPNWPGVTIYTDTEFYYGWIQRQATNLFCANQ